MAYKYHEYTNLYTLLHLVQELTKNPGLRYYQKMIEVLGWYYNNMQGYGDMIQKHITLLQQDIEIGDKTTSPTLITVRHAYITRHKKLLKDMYHISETLYTRDNELKGIQHVTHDRDVLSN